MMSYESIDAQIETLCTNIIKKNSEYWEDRNKNMLELTVLT